MKGNKHLFEIKKNISSGNTDLGINPNSVPKKKEKLKSLRVRSTLLRIIGPAFSAL